MDDRTDSIEAVMPRRPRAENKIEMQIGRSKEQ